MFALLCTAPFPNISVIFPAGCNVRNTGLTPGFKTKVTNQLNYNLTVFYSTFWMQFCGSQSWFYKHDFLFFWGFFSVHSFSTVFLNLSSSYFSLSNVFKINLWCFFLRTSALHYIFFSAFLHLSALVVSAGAMLEARLNKF